MTAEADVPEDHREHAASILSRPPRHRERGPGSENAVRGEISSGRRLSWDDWGAREEPGGL